MPPKGRQQKKPRTRRLRIFADDAGKVFLLSRSGVSVEVKRPVHEHLEEARNQLLLTEERNAKALKSAKTQELPPERAAAHKEIEAALKPFRKGSWFRRIGHGTDYIFARLLALFLSLVVIVLPYKGIYYSSENLPEPLHIVVLVLYGIALVWLLIVIGTEENRTKYRRKVNFWLGPYGMLVLPCALLTTAAGFLASITYRLHNRGLITLEACAGKAISEPVLVDFFMWHFVNIVPLLQLTTLVRWAAPYCYQQTRVGVLIAFFQALVVIPSFNTIRFYWKNRKRHSDYVFDPNWTL